MSEQVQQETTAEDNKPSNTDFEVIVKDAENKQKPDGYEQVDFNKIQDPELAQKVEARFNRLYAQMKESHTVAQKTEQILMEQAKQMDDLKASMASQKSDSTMADLRKQLKEAKEDSDYDREVRIQEQMANVVAEQKFADVKLEPKKAPEAQPAQPQNQGPALSDNELSIVEAWQNERNDRNEVSRPWAYYGHPDYQDAMAEVQAVLVSKRFANKSMQEKLAEVDKRMGMSKNSDARSVLGGNLTMPNKSKTIELTPAQKEIALKLGRIRGLDDETALKRYASSLKNLENKG